MIADPSPSAVTFPLPACLAALVAARDAVRAHYADILGSAHADGRLAFTFDGNLVGDLGEAIAVERFGIRLVSGSGAAGIDGHAPDGRSVQVKATITGGGPAFRQVPDAVADHLLFLQIDLAANQVIVVFNGPQAKALRLLPELFEGQRSLSAAQVRAAAATVEDGERLPLIAIGA